MHTHTHTRCFSLSLSLSFSFSICYSLSFSLSRVVEFGHTNRMQSSNLGIVFGPTVMRAETDSLEMAALMPVQNGIMELMISEFDKIFKK